MVMPPRSLLLMNVFIVFLFLMMSCGNREMLVGRYQAENLKNPQSRTLFLELKANGRGSWSIEEDNVSFKWEIRKKEIWLHTQLGGVIVGKISGNSIEVSLPGVGIYSFKRLLVNTKK